MRDFKKGPPKPTIFGGWRKRRYPIFSGLGEGIAAVAAIAFAAALFVGVICIPALLTMWAWNYAVVPTFDAKPIGLWVAFCLWFLTGLFFRRRK
jgi:hypothetical protein